MSGPSPSLAAERTALAWRRTALGLVGASLAAGRLLSVTWGVGAWAVALVGALLALVVLRAGLRRRTAVHGRSPGALAEATARSVHRDPGGGLVAACAGALVLLALAALAIVLTWPR